MSADIISSFCGIGVHIRMNNFSSKTTSPRDMQFFKDTSSVKDGKVVQGMQICSFACLLEPIRSELPFPKWENSNALSQFSHWLLPGFSLILHICTSLQVDSLSWVSGLDLSWLFFMNF